MIWIAGINLACDASTLHVQDAGPSTTCHGCGEEQGSKLSALWWVQAGLITGPLPPRIAARVQSLTGDASARAPPQPPAPRRSSTSGSLDGSPAAPAAGPHTPQQVQSQQPVPLQPRTASQRTDSPARRRASAPRPAWQPGGEDIAADTPQPAEVSTPGSVLSPAEQVHGLPTTLIHH